MTEPDDPQPQRRARWWQHLVALGVSVSFSLVLAEVLLRIFWPQTLGMSWQNDEGLFLHLPGRVVVYERSEFKVASRFNALGFRGAEVVSPKPPGSFRILALGDSFTEGLQVIEEELFTTRIARAFAGGEPKVEVINAGVSGYGPADVLALYDVFGEKLQPDLVIVFFCLQNDVMNDVMGGRCRLTGTGAVCNPVPARRGWSLALVRAKGLAGSYSHLYQLVRGAAASSGLERLGLRAQAPPEGTPAMPFGNDKYEEPLPPYFEEGWKLSEALLAQLRDRVRATGAELWLVGVPAREQVQDEDWAKIVAAEAGRTLVRDQIQRKLASLGTSIGVPVIDPYPAFLARNAAGDPLYWVIDGHFGAVGHEVVARAVVDEMKARGLPAAAREVATPSARSAPSGDTTARD